MNYCVYAIYDAKARVYSQPFYAVNAEVAARIFEGAANDAASTVSKHPLDFALYALGTFDDELGEFTNYGSPQNLGFAHSFKSEVKNASE